jgi:homoserine O-succinyltransferase
MPLLLPVDYPYTSRLRDAGITCILKTGADDELKPVKAGLFNIMPEAEKYEFLLLNRLGHSSLLVEPMFLRATKHVYGSSNAAHLARYYVNHDLLSPDKPDVLLLTGAPVEKLPNTRITYWSEIEQLVRYCTGTGTPLLGICWGGIAIGNILGISTEVTDHKIFGVHEAVNLRPGSPVMHGIPHRFYCPQSRYALLSEAEMVQSEHSGIIHRLASGRESGTFLFESTDGILTGHLGHPEYLPERLVFEWTRDQSLGLDTPHNGFDPHNPTDNWSVEANQLFHNWLLKSSAKTENTINI